MIAAANGVCGAAAADKDDDGQMNGRASYQDASINGLFQGADLESGTTAAAVAENIGCGSNRLYRQRSRNNWLASP